MMNLKKNNLGYTLVEIVMTTAIIGSLAAIAVPNYMRVKMNVNMEMVKQQIKILGQEMNEFYNKSNPHRYPETLPPTGNSEEELSITASLNGINNKGYEVRHFPAQDGSSFSDRIDPQPAMFGIAGDKCFVLDPMGLREIQDCFSAEGMDMSIMESSVFSATAFNAIFSDPNLSESEKISILSGMFIQYGLYVDYFVKNILTIHILTGGFDPAKIQSSTGLPAFFAAMNPADKPAFDQLIDKVAAHLMKEGFQIFISEDQIADKSTGEVVSGLKIAVQFDEYPSANEDAAAYKEYIQENYATLGYPKEESGIMGKEGTENFLVGENCFHCA